MKLSQMKQLLAERGLRLTKSLGQNFLHDANQLRRIVAAAELKPDDKVLEIGPGLGPLTALLVEQAGEVLAIEKDARLADLLEQRLASQQCEAPAAQKQSGTAPTRLRAGLHLLRGDALAFLKQVPHDLSGWKLVSNLPYSVASPILVELAQAERGPERLVVTLQAEVGRRLTARPDDADYGLLTLLIQMNYLPRSCFNIPASCFFPQPDVDSACVTLVRRECPVVAPDLRQIFVRLVKLSFSQRRKMMLKLLKSEWSSADLIQAYQVVGLSPEVRAEGVSLDQFAALAKQLHDRIRN
jgi:16S rRNA (adenine1518-N6/adenine1519-N6)-dimethyltransferase